MYDQISFTTNTNSFYSRNKLNSNSIKTRQSSRKNSIWASKRTGFSPKENNGFSQYSRLLNTRKKSKRKGKFYQNINTRKIKFADTHSGKFIRLQNTAVPRKIRRKPKNSLNRFSPIGRNLFNDPHIEESNSRTIDLHNSAHASMKTLLEKKSKSSRYPKTAEDGQFAPKISCDWSTTSPLIEQSKTMLEQCKELMAKLEERYLTKGVQKDTNTSQRYSPLRGYKMRKRKFVQRRSSYIESNYRYRFIPKALKANKDYKKF